jgi:hypothetical protein
MGLNGFIVMAPGGIPVYSNLSATKLAIEPTLIAGFLSAIQSFSLQLTSGAVDGINEMTMHDMRILYRHMEGFTFIGIVDTSDKIKEIESVMEYIICGFLARYREQLQNDQIHETTAFSAFDAFFVKWRKAKEKELQKWCERVSPTLLQGVLNLLVNYFPAAELVHINPSVLKIIGQKLLWVDVHITESAEGEIFTVLRKKVASIYGPGMFEKLVAEAKKNLETQSLMH